MDKKTILVSAVALIDQDGKICLAQRPLHKHKGGLWEFPGGKIEQGETPEQALIREIHEELQIDILQKDLFPLSFVSHEYEDFYLLMLLFGCRKWTGDLQKEEHIALQWVFPHDMSSVDLVPADIPLISLLKKLL